MTRLIDADALTNELIKGIEEDTDKSIQSSLAKSVCMLICKAIERQPTIDAEPVRHAKLLNAHPYGECSNCGYLIDIREEFNYCPNCGCRMDG
jgi:hypothetical protein